MPSSASGTYPQQPLQSVKINNEGNNGLIGDGSNNIFAVNSVIQINDSEDELERLLGRHVSTDALCNSFYSPPECHPNTRITIRNEIGGWIDESVSEKSPLLWLNGPAAVGKSVIAKTISGFHDQIVATFFFSTSSDKSAATLFPTLAWQLARKIPDTRKHIIASLKNNGSLQTTQIKEQFDLLILQPLKSVTTLRSRPVMVIDGVDECIDESMLVRFLRALVRAGEGGGMPVRFLIYSRPEPRIRAILGRAHDVNPTVDRKEPQLPSLLHRFLDLVSLSQVVYIPRFEPHTPVQWSLFLQDVWELYKPRRIGVDKYPPSPSDTYNELADTLDRISSHPVISTLQIGFSEECKQDIARYLTDSFNAIPQPGDGTCPWFQPSDISDLVEASCGQFLYASTIARLLDEPHFDSRDIFEMARRSSLPTPDLNKLYKAILKRAHDTIRNQAQEGGLDHRTELRFLIDSLAMLVIFAGNVHFFTVPKRFPVIESLLGLSSGKLTHKLSKMHSVLKIVPGESVEVHHRSFLEFLQSRERSGEFYISDSAALRWIVILMCRAGLGYNTFKNNDIRRLYVRNMIDTCHRNFFERSRFPHVYRVHFYYTHILMIILLALLFSTCIPLLTLPIPRAWQLIMPLFLGFPGVFVLSLTTYTFFLNRSIIVPFFHPFLHPFIVFTSGS